MLFGKHFGQCVAKVSRVKLNLEVWASVFDLRGFVPCHVFEVVF